MTEATPKPSDNFRDQMASSAMLKGGPDLAHQSLGRTLSVDETALAAALMDIYGSGVTEMGQVASELAARNLNVPDQTGAAWSETVLQDTLKRLNEGLDAAYQDNGYGA